MFKSKKPFDFAKKEYEDFIGYRNIFKTPMNQQIYDISSF